MYGGMYDGHGANYQTVKRHQRPSNSRGSGPGPGSGAGSGAGASRPVDALPFPLSPLPVGKYLRGKPASPDHLKLTREPPSPLKLRRQQFAAEGREFHRATRTSASISGSQVRGWGSGARG